MSLPTKAELLAQLVPDPKPECPICWEEMKLQGFRNWAHVDNVLKYMNHFRTLQQSASTGSERSFIGLDQDIGGRLVAACALSRPRPVNGVSDADRCIMEWRLVTRAFQDFIDQLRGIWVTGSTLSELLSKKSEFALQGRYASYGQAIAQSPGAMTFKDDVESCIALFVTMTQRAYDEKVAAKAPHSGDGACSMS
ncbi:hypothetical protein AC578_6406 [Pseudocercospora eumusae]|uniref:Uncharacterized protein n=1 Tax=Pseudocercospora eumusae TaxID=321146 RepID=A0A139H6S5_9PEZI|nr:hypothetical protein AC578_6406 [Pseudocercospora eumusae]